MIPHFETLLIFMREKARDFLDSKGIFSEIEI